MIKNQGMGKYQAYVWKGQNKWQKKVSGIIVADGDFSAENQARQLGVSITYFKQRSVMLLSRGAAKSIKIADIVFTMRQLSTLITSGIPLVQALEIMAEGLEKVKLRALLLTVRDSLAAGGSFSEALSEHPQFFPPMLCGLIAAGEESGTLDQIVKEIASYLERQEQLKRMIKKALYYPVTVICIALLIAIGMLVFLVPQFEAIYASFGAKLPAFTQAFVNFSNALRQYWWLMLIGVAAFVYGLLQLNKRSFRFQRMRDRLILNVILFGDLARKAIISRICLTLSITLSAGIPLINALSQITEASGNILFSEALAQTREEITQGEPMAKSLQETYLFPALVIQMVNIGEKSGSLEEMLRKVAEYYREQVNAMVDGLTTMLEPILLVLISGVIGSFIIAMYLPIFNLGMAMK